MIRESRLESKENRLESKESRLSSFYVISTEEKSH